MRSQPEPNNLEQEFEYYVAITQIAAELEQMDIPGGLHSIQRVTELADKLRKLSAKVNNIELVEITTEIRLELANTKNALADANNEIAALKNENRHLKEEIENLKNNAQENESGSELDEDKIILISIKSKGIEALAYIEKIDNYKEPEHGNKPHCTVEDLAKVLDIDWVAANKLIKKLKRFDLVYCYWENLNTWHVEGGIANAEKPVRITEDGKQFLDKYRAK